MSLKRTVSTNNEEFEQPPSGTHRAFCVAVIVTGTHEETWKGVKKEVEKIFLAWEFAEELMADGKTRWVIGREYTFSLNGRANLRQLIDAWASKPLKDGDAFDLALLAGSPCMVTVVETEKNSEGRTYRNVEKVVQLPARDRPTIGKPQRTPFVYDAIDLDAGAAGLEALPEWLPRTYGQLVADRIKDSKEWKASAPGPAPAAAANLPEMDPNAYDNEIRF
jgi:hypothetical protein